MDRRKDLVESTINRVVLDFLLIIINIMIKSKYIFIIKWLMIMLHYNKNNIYIYI